MESRREDLEALASILEASGAYRVLRRLEPRTPTPAPDGERVRLGLFVDVETTGLDHRQDEIIELAMIPFRYGETGTLFEVLEPFHAYRQPSRPIPPDITALTGIDDDVVAGKMIDPDVVGAFAAPAALVVAHNAAFDRRFLERLSPAFSTKPWACSMRQVDWASEGFEGVKLAYLAANAGFFYDRHRATNDCLAALELLARPLPRSGVSGLTALLDQARRPSWRLSAEGAPFAMKDQLKARGYRWSGEEGVPPRCWYIDVSDADLAEEQRFLAVEIYVGDQAPLVRRIDAFDRFSDRDRKSVV